MLRDFMSYNAHAKKSLTVLGKTYSYYDLNILAAETGKDISKLPYSLKVVLENLLRHQDDSSVTQETINQVADWALDKGKAQVEIAYRPARVLMQDFTGVPAVVDLAAMRDATKKLGGNVQKINPLVPVDLVIDHSVMVDFFGTQSAFKNNVDLEYTRNIERYQFLRWGQQAFENFRVVPPGTGICHQVNLEYLAKVAWTKSENGEEYVYPDTLVGTDSHTTMVNGLGVLGWGVGGIEAEAAMLGQPISMVVPEVIGFKLTGKLNEGVTATDLVLTVTEMLRKKGVVGKFVEFYGSGLSGMPLEDRATIANMAPEYGATCGFFPVDNETIAYLKATGRSHEQIALTESYAKAQGLWRDENAVDPIFTDTLLLDMHTVEPSIAGPKRPQDRVALKNAAAEFEKALTTSFNKELSPATDTLKHGDVVIAAITSCTNTSNPYVMIAAGLVARKAIAKGLKVSPHVKPSLSPGSQVVTDYLLRADLQKDLDAAGFTLTGYGCMTCIGNSGPLPDHIASEITNKDLVAVSVLSGNRNFEGRVNQHVKANYLASPPLVVAYAFAGTILKNLTTDVIGVGSDGQNVYLKDIWPTSSEVAETVRTSVTADMFTNRYGNVFLGDTDWQAVKGGEGKTFEWDNASTYVQNPPYFEGMQRQSGIIEPLDDARILAIFGDSITTDHISPAGNIKKTSPAGLYLQNQGVDAVDFNSYGARRGNHEVMMRGTFANIRIKNELLGGEEGGDTLMQPSGKRLSIYDAAMAYAKTKTPLVIFAGKEYGTGSSRDWAAKGTMLLGIKAVIAESFERIHRSNLVGMGILPLVFNDGMTRTDLNLKGDEVITIDGLDNNLQPRSTLNMLIKRADGNLQTVPLLCRIDTLEELEYFRNGGIMQYVLRKLVA
jgi:aconitate hydratase